ncbi:MAG: tyrosine-type recombinase/integrase, partial [Acidobacteriota bacterium]|nr:tyrosine-type recombinase/integrase [Acidobacteriota bacterium]
SARTWTKELGTIRHFFRHCLHNEWILRNWAEKVPMPKNLKPADREPYEPREVASIIAACDQMGRGAYERLRARAMILVLRYTGLRISDVATLERDRIRDGQIFLRTAKNGKPVRLPVHADLQAALEVLPLPRGADSSNWPYFFWSGHGSRETFIRNVKRTLVAVFRISGVPGACPHRFAIRWRRRFWRWAEPSKRPPISSVIPKRSCASIMQNGARGGRRESMIFWHVCGTRKNRRKNRL